MVAPKEMGSKPSSLHRMLAYCRASRSSVPVLLPRAQAASYSRPPVAPPVLRLVYDAEVGFVELGDPPAGDGAAEAGLVGDEVALAVGPLLGHGFGGDLARAFELDVTVVARGRGADFVDDVHQDLGAIRRQALAGNGVVGEHFLGGLGGGHEGFAVTDGAGTLGAAYGDGLEVLGSHDGADPGTAGGAVQVIDDAGVFDAVLAGAADAGDADLRVLVAFLDGFFGLEDGLAPQMAGILEFDFVVFDGQIDGLGTLAFEDDHVPAGEFEFGTEVAARVGAGNGPGEGTLGNDGVAPAGAGGGAGERPGGHDHLVLGGERVDLGVDFFDEVFGGQPPLSEVFLGPLHVEGFAFAGAFGEVNAQYLFGPSHVGLLDGV